MFGYEELIPDEFHPKAEIAYPAKLPGDPPVKELYEIKHRC